MARQGARVLQREPLTPVTDWRIRKNLTQAEMGRACGVPPASLARFERTGRIGSTNLLRIAEYMGVDPFHLVPARLLERN